MARSSNNVLTRNYTGTVAGQYSLRMKGDQSILAGLPKPRKERSDTEKTKAVKRKFSLAVIYGKKAIANPELKAAYQAIAKKNSLPIMQRCWMHSKVPKSTTCVQMDTPVQPDNPSLSRQPTTSALPK